MNIDLITICTPTFNRGYIIKNLYHSLQEQSVNSFEWLVIDDGSNDDTEEIFQNILKENNPFPIRYLKQENGGKHRAVNIGVKEAKGELFFIVDSDDYLTNDAVEKLFSWVKTLDSSRKWAGVAGYRGTSKDNRIGELFGSTKYIDAKNTERLELHLLGDKAEAYFTEILKKYPYPEFENENFVTPDVVWNAIANDGYYMRWFSDIIWICNYLADGITNDKNKFIRNPKGFAYWVKQTIQIYKEKSWQSDDAILLYYNSMKSYKNIFFICRELNLSLPSFVRVFIRKKMPRPIINIYNSLFSHDS